jgi:hypothetical protein
MDYAQVITPGFSIVLEVKGERHMYHTDQRQSLVHCESQGSQLLPDAELTETVARAKEDLAQRLGTQIDSVDVVAVMGQQFPADAFYCRTAKERVARDESPVVILGQTILLSAAGHRYEYHANEETVIFCRQLR